ncbi:SAG family member [Eimeria brunetti]|uniref:SAG family member n=1 Tax=Eimeria brunetti TaxID=51314 RepID=U6LCZ4_9EIME|nr:SAG family member [Eimeria brunetti]
MASLYRTAAAVCLVGLYGLQSEAAGTTITYKFTPIVVDDAGYVAANLVRNGKLPVHISAVAKDDNLVSTLTETVKTKESKVPVENERDTIDKTCSVLVEPEGLKDIFHYTFEYNDSASKSSPNYRELLQKALEAGLEIFKNAEYQNNWGKIWNDDAGGSLAYLLGANSTTIGCVIGQCTTEKSTNPGGRSSTATPTGNAVLFCTLKPAAQKGEAPFDDEYFTGLIARTAKLADMTEEDLKAPTNDGTAAAAVPTLLAAGLVAVLTALPA